MSSINPNPQSKIASDKPDLKKEQGGRGSLRDPRNVELKTITLGSLNSSAYKVREAVHRQFPSTTSESGGGGGGKATPPPSPKSSLQRASLLREIIDDGLDSEEEFEGAPQRLSSVAQKTGLVGNSHLSQADPEKKGSAAASVGTGAMKLSQITEGGSKYVPSDFVSIGFDHVFQKKMEAALIALYQFSDPEKSRLSQKQAAESAQEDFHNKLSNIANFKSDSMEPNEDFVESSKRLKQTALNSVNNDILKILIKEFQGKRFENLGQIIREILIQSGYACSERNGEGLIAANGPDFLNLSNALKGVQKQLDFCIDLFEKFRKGLLDKGFSQEDTELVISHFVKKFKFSPRKSKFKSSEIKELIKKAEGQHRFLQETKGELIKKEIDSRVIDYAFYELLLTKYKHRLPTAEKFVVDLETYIAILHLELINSLAKKFQGEGWNFDAARSRIDSVMKGHGEEIGNILKKNGFDALKNFVNKTIEMEVREILQDDSK